MVQPPNVLDLSRWFTLKLPDLSKEGIRFRSISGDFAVRAGVFSTQNLIVDSDDLRMTGGGKIDLANDEIGLSWPSVLSPESTRRSIISLCSVEVSRPSKFFFWSPASISRVPSKIPPSPRAVEHDVGMGFRRSWNSEKILSGGEEMKKRNLKTARQRSRQTRTLHPTTK